MTQHTQLKKAMDLIGPIYEASHDEKLWPGVIEQLSDALDSVGGILIYDDFLQKNLQINHFGRLNPEGVGLYNDYYITKDFRLQAVMNVPPGVPYSEETLLPHDYYLKSEILNDFYIKWDGGRAIGTVLFRTPRTNAVIGIQKLWRDPPYGKDEFSLCEIIFPHIQNAITLHEQIKGVKSVNLQLWEMFDKLDTPIILFSKHARPLFFNQKALDLLNLGDGLYYEHGFIKTSNHHETIALHRMIRQACRTSTGEDYQPCQAISIYRPSGKRSYIIKTTPVCIDRFVAADSVPVASVIITDPDESIILNYDMLQTLWGLTGSEIKIIELLLKGNRAVDIADELGISPNTVKTHLKHCYEKTNTNSQADLLRFLLNCKSIICS